MKKSSVESMRLSSPGKTYPERPRLLVLIIDQTKVKSSIHVLRSHRGNKMPCIKRQISRLRRLRRSHKVHSLNPRPNPQDLRSQETQGSRVTSPTHRSSHRPPILRTQSSFKRLGRWNDMYLANARLGVHGHDERSQGPRQCLVRSSNRENRDKCR